MTGIYKRILRGLTDALDPLYSSVYDLQNANRDDTVKCTVLCTRSKIYTKGIEVIKLIKQKKYTELEPLINRLFRLINIHRNQLYKLTKTKVRVDLKNFVFLKNLKTLFTLIRGSFLN